MASWDVVIFTKDNSCEYVPSSWAIDINKELYVWPKKLSSKQIKNLRDNCAEPSSSIDYEEWLASCRATVYSLSEAQRLVQKVIYTSNLSSDEDEPIYIPEVGTEVIVNEGSLEVGASTHFKSCHNAPKRFCVDETQLRSSSATELSSRIVSNRTYSPSTSTTTRNVQMETLTELKKLTKALTGIIFEVTELKNDINNINIKLNSLSEKWKSQIPSCSKFNLPVCTQLDLENLEQKLMDPSSDDFEDLVNILAHVGGTTPKKNVLLVMKKIFTKELSLTFSAKGKKQKKDFSSLKLYVAVLSAVKINFPNCTDLEITQFIGLSLATAGDRDGGRTRRVSGPARPITP